MGYVKVDNREYDGSKSVKKGMKGAAAGGVGAAVATLVTVALSAVQAGEVSDSGLTLAGGALVTLLTAGCTGAVEWYRNRRKHKTKRVWRSGPYGVLLVGLAGTLAMGLVGCITTTLPDGTVVERMDPVAVELGGRLLAEALAGLEEEGAAVVYDGEEMAWPDWLLWLVDANGDGVLTRSELERQARVFEKAGG